MSRFVLVKLFMASKRKGLDGVSGRPGAVLGYCTSTEYGVLHRHTANLQVEISAMPRLEAGRQKRFDGGCPPPRSAATHQLARLWGVKKKKKRKRRLSGSTQNEARIVV